MDTDKKRQVLEELGGISEDVYDDLVKDFLAQAHESLDKLKGLLNNQDFTGVKGTLHFIKGSSGNLRLSEIYELVKGLEEKAVEKNEQALKEGVVQLEALIAALSKQYQ